MAARHRARSLGQRDDAHRRRRYRAGVRAARRAGPCGTRVEPRERLRDPAAGDARAAARRRHAAHLRPVPRCLSRARSRCFSAAVQAVAALDESADDNPLAALGGAALRARVRRGARRLWRRASAASLEASGPTRRAGDAYLAATSHAYGGDGEGAKRREAFARASPAPTRSSMCRICRAGRARRRRLRRTRGRLRRRRRTCSAQRLRSIISTPRGRQAPRCARSPRRSPARARPRHQSALDRRADAPRPSRRGGDRRDARQSVRLRGADRRRRQRAVRSAVRATLGDDGCAPSSSPPIRKPRGDGERFEEAGGADCGGAAQFVGEHSGVAQCRRRA